MTQLPLNGATLGFEDTLWDMADQMRGHMDPAEYKHVVRYLHCVSSSGKMNAR